MIWGTGPQESKNILAAYLDRGGNSVDTANLYTNGHSEKIIGGGSGRKAIVHQLFRSSQTRSVVKATFILR